MQLLKDSEPEEKQTEDETEEDRKRVLKGLDELSGN
jgi:hypothetical protein